MKQFTNLYQVSKTLRFELKPIGKTRENIEKDGLIEQDENRAESYKKVKKIIDEYHKDFIERTLSNFKLKYEDDGNKDSLSAYLQYYRKNPKDEKDKKEFETIQKNLRKQIADSFNRESVKEEYADIFKKELIKNRLPDFVQTEEERKLVGEFRGWTTYFTGFHKSRKNMYSTEAKSGAIAYRLIHENLPKFIDNMNVFEKVAATEVKKDIEKLYENMSEYLNVNEISEMFKLNYYSEVLTQTQIDVYNAIIGGMTKEEGKIKIQGLNEYINLYNQQQKDKSARLPKLKPLYKQILSDRNAISWLPEAFENDDEVLESIEKCYQEIDEEVIKGKYSLKSLLEHLSDFDMKGIYLRNDLSLADISQQLFGDWRIIKNAIRSDFENRNPKKPKEAAEKYEECIKKLMMPFESFSVDYINDCLKNAGHTAGVQDYFVQDYFVNMELTDKETNRKYNVFDRITEAYSAVKDLLNTPYPENKNLSQDKGNIALIKNLLDALKTLQRFVKPLLGSGDEADKDAGFYGEFAKYQETFERITHLYNKVRNYVTRKPYSEEKIKLNFENDTLLKGWDLNKETDNTCVLLRKDGMYYLGIMNKKHNDVFETENIPSVNGNDDFYEKMVYKQIANAGRDIQNLILCKNGEYRRFTENLDPQKKENIPDIYDIKVKGSYLPDKPQSQNKKFDKKDLNTFIDYYKKAAENYRNWQSFEFKFKPTPDYSTWTDFTNDLRRQGYRITFCDVPESYINQLVEEGKLYLFQIYNKDFSTRSKSKGTPNMHTLYWKMLFDERNLADVVYKLNGQAEVFFRKPSIKYDKPTYLAGIPIKNKNENNLKPESVFSYNIIKDNRYTKESFKFHVPITLNFKEPEGKDIDINEQVNHFIKEYNDIHIIGIDRGERHLLYLTLIDLQGNIKEQFSLNEIINEYKGNTYTTDYHQLLDAKEIDRKDARESWQTIENIKDLKEGYLSQVIHKITQLMVKYHAIVVLEDLNSGFMRGRQKVEKSVYQQFEHKLIDKLNYLVDKKADAKAEGGLLHAYQLTDQFESFKKLKLDKQSGFLFYVPAWMTSKIDPTTGFVNLFDTRYENEKKSREFFEKFDNITYNAQKDWFEFAFDYDNFTAKAEGTRTRWTLCTSGSRIETFRNPEINLTEEFKKFFNYDYDGNLKAKILTQSGKPFWEGLLRLFRLTLQMRNSRKGTEEDYLISPVMNDKGEFYDSRTCVDALPQNADANGAYNIARKGLWIVEQIKKTKDNDMKNLKLAISNKEWLKFAQEKHYL